MSVKMAPKIVESTLKLQLRPTQQQKRVVMKIDGGAVTVVGKISFSQSSVAADGDGADDEEDSNAFGHLKDDKGNVA